MIRRATDKRSIELMRKHLFVSSLIFDWDIDYSKGEVSDGKTKVILWSKNGYRLTFELVPKFGFIVIQSQFVDEVYKTLSYIEGHEGEEIDFE